MFTLAEVEADGKLAEVIVKAIEEDLKRPPRQVETAPKNPTVTVLGPPDDSVELEKAKKYLQDIQERKVTISERELGEGVLTQPDPSDKVLMWLKNEPSKDQKLVKCCREQALDLNYRVGSLSFFLTFCL